MIQANKITKSYPGAGIVVDHADITISSDEFVTVMGPSGCGKSTFLFLLSGMETLDGGEVLFNGRNLSDLTEEEKADFRRKKAGFVFQEPFMLKHLNIIDNILLPHLDGNNGEVLRKKAASMLDLLGIGAVGDRAITEVSGGQLQRACILRAVLGNPAVIFADEPTGALNSEAAMEVMDLLQEIHEKGTAVVLVTHDPAVAARGTRLLKMKDGKILEDRKLR